MKPKDGESVGCVVLTASPIEHPAVVKQPLDCMTFTSKHSLDMKFTECDSQWVLSFYWLESRKLTAMRRLWLVKWNIFWKFEELYLDNNTYQCSEILAGLLDIEEDRRFWNLSFIFCFFTKIKQKVLITVHCYRWVTSRFGSSFQPIKIAFSIVTFCYVRQYHCLPICTHHSAKAIKPLLLHLTVVIWQ